MGRAVADVMSTHIDHFSPSTSCLVAWGFMYRTGAEHVAVLNDAGHVVGVVSRQDIAMSWADHDVIPSRRTLGALLFGRARPKVGPQTPVERAAQVMLDSQADALPVVNQDGTLAGVVSAHDVLAMVAELERPRVVEA
jgi:CBS domain-containing protein